MSLTVDGEVKKQTYNGGQLEDNFSLLLHIGCIFIYVSTLPEPQHHLPPPPTSPHLQSPPPPTPKPRLFVTVVIGRLNSVQCSPDPHPTGSLQTLRRYKRKQNS